MIKKIAHFIPVVSMILALAIASFFAFVASTQAATPVTQVVNGGTGSSTLTGILVGNGKNPLQTLIIGTNLTLTGHTLNATGGGGSGASTTLLGDTNTFSGHDTFSNIIIGSITGNAATVTNGIYTTDTGTVTNTMLAGSIANAKLLNSSITVNGVTFNLGDSKTITAASSTLLGDSNTFSGTLNKFSNAPALGLTGLVKGNGSSAATVGLNGTDFTLVTANTCGAGQFFNAGTAAGVFSCGTPAGTTYTGTYPIIVTGSVISSGFSTTTTWGAGNNGLVMTGATGIPFVQATSSAISLNISGNAATVTTNANLTGVVTSSGNATSFAASPTFSGTVTGTSFSGAGTGLTGTAASLSIGGNAATVTTNANLTGVVTSVGNATSFAASPTFSGTVTGTSFSGAGTGLTGTAASLSIGGNAATVTTNANLTGVITSSGNTTSFGSQSAGVLGNPATGNTAVQATSTLYGAVQNGKVLAGVNGVLAYVATSTDSCGTGVTCSYSGGTNTFSIAAGAITDSMLSSTFVKTLSFTTGQGVSGSFTAGATPALSLTLGALTGVTSYNGLVVTANTGTITTGIWNGTTIALANGGTNATSFTTSGNAVYYNGSSLLTAPLTSAITIPYASTTEITASSNAFVLGNLDVGTTTPQSKLLYVYGNQSGGIARIQRFNASTNATLGTYSITAESTGIAADGFGVGQTFELVSDGVNPNTFNTISTITAVRHGADNSGTLGLFGYSAGSPNAALYVDGPSGVVAVGTSTPGNACNAQGFCVANGTNALINMVAGTTALVNTFFDSANNGTTIEGEVGTATNHPFTFWSNNLKRMTLSAAGFLGIATTTPQFPLSVANATIPQISLSDTSITSSPWYLRGIGSSFYIGTSSPTTFATSSNPSIWIDGTKAASLSVGSTTPTFAAINGLVTLGSNGANGSTTVSTGRLQFDTYNAAGTRSCAFIVGTAWVVSAGACNP